MPKRNRPRLKDLPREARVELSMGRFEIHRKYHTPEVLNREPDDPERAEEDDEYRLLHAELEANPPGYREELEAFHEEFWERWGDYVADDD